MTKEKIASFIDHTQLSPCAKSSDIKKLCEEALKYNFASVCINPCYVPLASSILKGSAVKVCTVIGFPLGNTTSKDKAAEAFNAVQNGADEVDMVINPGMALEGLFEEVEKDISSVVQSAKNAGSSLSKSVTVKVILETCFLDDETIRNACLCAVRAKADFVKTSTGFASPKDKDGKLLPNGAQARHVKIMRETVGKDFGVKASGGIRSAKTCLEMVLSGANRIGTSSGVKIVEEWDESVKIQGID